MKLTPNPNKEMISLSIGKVERVQLLSADTFNNYYLHCQFFSMVAYNMLLWYSLLLKQEIQQYLAT